MACVWIVALMQVSCYPEPIADDVEILEGDMVEHTLVMYLNANNNLATHILANANDAERGMLGVPASTRLVIYLDKQSSTTLYEVKFLQYGSYNFVKHSTVLKEYPDQVSTTPEVMKAVFEDIKVLAPSKTYGLVHAGHGSGWFPTPDSGIGYENQKNRPGSVFDTLLATSSIIADEYDFGFFNAEAPLTRAMGYDNDGSKKRYTTTEEFVEGISPIRFDYIIFDACFMSSVEFLYELRNVTDYVIASPVEVMGPGFPYEDIMPLLMAPNHSLTAVCEKIMEVYRNDRTFSKYDSAAVALIDCSKLEGLTDCVADVWSAISSANEATESEVASLIATEIDKKAVQVLDRMRPAGFYDLKDYVEQLAIRDGEAFDLTDFNTALAEAVVFADNTTEITSYGYPSNNTIPMLGYGVIDPKAGSDKVRLCGLSCYIPSVNAPVTQSYYFQTSWSRKVYGL